MIMTTLRHDKSFNCNNKIMRSMVLHLFRKVVVAVCILLVTCNPVVEADKKNNLSYQNLEFQNHFKGLNKTPVKSIKSPDGDIIDCIHIAHQPAFDHPLLQNHTIQMRPNYHPEGAFVTNTDRTRASKPIIQLWRLNGECPKGTIPIRRTKNDYKHKASSIRTFGKMKHQTIPQSRSIHNSLAYNTSQGEFAVAYVNGDKYFGAKATMNAWNPEVEQFDEHSSALILIQGGVNLNSIEVGWQVHPALNSDNYTRFYIYWFNELLRDSGCYDLRCPGFVQISNEIALGASLYPLSSYEGSQYAITLLVWKNPADGNWWLNIGETLNVLGYWPYELLSDLDNGASTISWGGQIVNLNSGEQHTATQMGSGHFPEEGFSRASYFKNIFYVDGSNTLTTPNKDTQIFASQSGCYDIKYGEFPDGNEYFFYGGPGRNPKCP